MHHIYGEMGFTHYENLVNLDELMGRGRYWFIGFPLKIRGRFGQWRCFKGIGSFDRFRLTLHKKAMHQPEIILQKRDQLFELCHQFGVKCLFAFGSVVSNQFDPEKSDLDFLVEMEEMPPLERGENLIGLWEALEALFARKVDLISNQPIKNPYLRDSIERSKLLIYDRESEKVFV